MSIIETLREYAKSEGLWDDPPRPEPASESLQSAHQPDFVPACANHPSDRGISHGHTHIQLNRPLAVGRLRREPGDALCKPARAFWGLYTSHGRITCPRCIEIAKRYGLASELTEGE